MTIMMLGIDLGKNSCSVAGLDEAGTVVLRRRMQPKTILSFASKLPPCAIAMEACCGAHHLGRLLADQGHDVRLMSPEYVRPYVKAHKNDDRDAEAIAEAATRPTMRFVELKSQEQLDVQSLHRTRSRLVGARTNLTNQLRAILLERGTTIAQGLRKLEQALDALLANSEFMAGNRIRRLLAEMREEWADSTGASKHLIGNLSHSLATMRLPIDWCPFPGSAFSTPRRSSPLSETARPLPKHAISALGWDLYRDNIRPAANLSCSASASAATSIYERY